MSPAASWSGSIQLGVMQFPVKAVACDRETKFSFNQHHGAPPAGVLDEDAPICGGRVRQQPGACEDCGAIVEKEQIVRGWDGKPGIDEDWIKSLEKERSAVMEIDGLVPASQIEPRWHRRSYDVLPGKGADKLAELLRVVMTESGRVAVGKVVMSGKETIVVLRPRGESLEMALLWWPNELKVADTKPVAVTLKDTEIAMGMKLVEYMATDFDPEAYVDEYAQDMDTYLTAFSENEAPPKIVGRERPAALDSLEDSLAASLAKFEKPAEKVKRKKKDAA